MLRTGAGRPTNGMARAVATGALVAMLVTSGCGSRLSQSRLFADAHGVGLSANTSSAAPGSAGQQAAASAGDQSSALTESGSGPAASSSTASSPGAGQTTQPGNGGTASANSGATDASAAAASTTCAKSLSPVVIGSVGESSGPIGSFIRTGPQAVQAWVASVNAK